MSNLGNKNIMAKNIKYYMNLKGVTQSEICNTLNLKTNTFSDWVNAKTYPRIDKIELLANYFGIEKSDLIEEHNPNDEDESLIILNRNARKMTPEQRKQLIEMAKIMFREDFND